MKIQTVNRSDGSVDAHKAGCRDLEKLARQPFVDVAAPVEFATELDVWEDYNLDFLAEGGGAYDVRFLPCAAALPAGERPMTEEAWKAHRS